MVSNQIISKVLNTKNFSIIEDNQLDETYFTEYLEEFRFLKNYYDKYKSVPDIETFLDKFEDFDILTVKTDDKYLVKSIRDEKLLSQAIPILNNVSELFEEGSSTEAVEYLSNQLKTLDIDYNLGGVDIISTAKNRYDVFKDRVSNQNNYYFKTGFPELDNIIHGIQRGEEFMVLFARINQGKSWVLEKMCTAVWEQGYNVGYISPEMGATSIGYRFDTLYKNFSNNSLMWGEALDNEKEYKKYLEELSKKENKMYVATQKDFGNRITISKLRNWIKQNKLDLLAIDGLKYITDERSGYRENLTTKLTNISEDLMSLSVEMGIPILGVIQANRGGVDDENGNSTLEMETIRDSDGPAANASKVLSLRQRNGILEIGVKKQRNGLVGSTIKYMWNINNGEFVWIPSKDDLVDQEIKDEQIKTNIEAYADDINDVF